jgi:hypothetical protein
MALRYKLLLSCCALTMTAACAYARGFRLEGRIEGLQAGDTLRFERILLPSWKYGPGFDVVVRKPGAFRHRGKSEHDQYYLMTYRPKAGRAAAEPAALEAVLDAAAEEPEEPQPGIAEANPSSSGPAIGSA